jgi:hypothetical protein
MEGKEFTLSTANHFRNLRSEDLEVLNVVLSELVDTEMDLLYNIRGIPHISETDEPTVELTGIWTLSEEQVEYLRKGGSPEASGFIKEFQLEGVEFFELLSGDDPTDEDLDITDIDVTDED